jgi:hypothetical protein
MILVCYHREMRRRPVNGIEIKTRAGAGQAAAALTSPNQRSPPSTFNELFKSEII